MGRSANGVLGRFSGSKFAGIWSFNPILSHFSHLSVEMTAWVELGFGGYLPCPNRLTVFWVRA